MAHSPLGFHEWLTRDPVSMGAYREAIASVVRAGDVVFDMGAGIGILGFMACEAGAARVYAIEPGDISGLIERLATANGFGNRVFVRKEFSWDAEMPEKADVIIASMLNCFGIDDQLLGVALDARRRLLRPGGTFIPSRIRMAYAPVEKKAWYEDTVDCWTGLRFGTDTTSARSLAANQPAGVTLAQENLLAQPVFFEELELATVESANVFSRGDFLVERSGVFQGLAGWFDAEMAPGVHCGNSPFDTRRVRWANLIFPAERSVPVEAGDRIEASIRGAAVDRQTVWVWNSKVVDAAGATKAEFRQSTLQGALFSKKLLAASHAGMKLN